MRKKMIALMLAMSMTFAFCAYGASGDSSSETAQEDSGFRFFINSFTVEDTEEEIAEEEAVSEGDDEETEESYEGSGYESAEDAALAYLEALKTADFEAAIGTFAIETAVENADTEAYLERVGRLELGSYPSFPLKINGTEEEKQLLIMLRYGDITFSIFTQMLFYDGLLDVVGGRLITFSSDDRENEVREYLSDTYGSDYFEDMSNVEFVSFYSISDLHDNYYSESIQNNIELVRVSYGADALEEVAMHIVLGGEDYLYCLQCAEYDGKWYVLQFSGYVGSLFSVNTYTKGLFPFDAVGIG